MPICNIDLVRMNRFNGGLSLRQQLPDGPQIGHLSKSRHYRFKLFHPGQVNAVPERP
jgi:hypothetical protein